MALSLCLAAGKLAAKLVVHRFTLGHFLHFFLLQKENIIIKAKLKILIRKKEHKNYLYCHYSQMVIVSVLLHFLQSYSYACSFFFFNKNGSILHTTL